MTEIYAGAESFEALVQLLGQGDALVLCREFGGQRVRIPKKVAQDHELAKRIGLQAAERMAEEFGGIALDVPLGRAVTSRRRAQVVATSPHSANEIARALGITQRHVRRIRAKIRAADDRQIDMFD
jgi:hypothetical protein